MKLVHVVLGLSILSLGLSLFLFFEGKQEEVVYVNMEEIFHGFDGTKEYTKELEEYNKSQKSVLDSMRLEVLSFASGRGDNDSIVLKKKSYYELVFNEFSKNRQEKSDEFDQKIWGQINEYVKTFGDQKSYKIIQGLRGDGAIMYAKDDLDITKDVLGFMNSKYAGNN